MRAAPPASVALFMHDLSGGGVERMRLKLAAGLAERGHAVTLIVQNALGVLRSEVPAGIELVDLCSPHSVMAALRLAAVLRTRRPNILVSSLDHNNIAALCARLLAGSGTRIIICQHNTLSAEAQLGWRYRVVPFLYRILAHWADGIVAVSQGVADDLARVTGLRRARISVIYNPIIQAEEEIDAAAPPHPWLADSLVPTFLFVGRMVAQKDPMLLLRAFALRLQVGPARLIFLGEGPLLPLVEQGAHKLGISHAVYCGGFVANPRNWMARVTALVLPSVYEGFGNVIVEAMASGTPVIAADCPHGPREILAGGRFGWLVPVGDAQALAAAMADDARASFAAARLRLRAQGFSVSACISRHQELFERILRRQRRVFGLAFTGLDAKAVCTLMTRENADGALRPVVSQNLDMLRLMRENPEFALATHAAAVICADGFPVTLYARLRGATIGPRVTGCDIFHRLAKTAHEHRRRIFVVVECDRTATMLRAWIAVRKLSGLWDLVVGPPLLLKDEEGQRALVKQIVANAPHILVLTLGAPASELFLYRCRNVLPACWALCCGQAVRVELGLERRAPAAWRRWNLEWAWRLAHEPLRLGPRYLRDAASVPALVLSDFRSRENMRRADNAMDVKLADYPGA